MILVLPVFGPVAYRSHNSPTQALTTYCTSAREKLNTKWCKLRWIRHTQLVGLLGLFFSTELNHRMISRCQLAGSHFNVAEGVSSAVLENMTVLFSALR